jgi:PKD repeat protein
MPCTLDDEHLDGALPQGDTATLTIAGAAAAPGEKLTVKVQTTDGTFIEQTSYEGGSNGGGGGPVNADPTAAFSFSPTDPETDETVTFTDASTDSDGTVVSWSWDFGDAATSTDQNPTHPYSSANTYTVRLTVTDNEGETNYVEHDVTVTAPAAPITIRRSPSADSGGGWSNEGNAYADSGGSASSNDNNEQCTFSGYGFTIPSGATNIQVRVRLDAWHSSSWLSDDDVRLDVYDGSWHTYTPNPIPLSSSETTIWCDATALSSDWTPSEVNTIQVRVTHIQDGWWADDIYLDWIPIEVTYTP